MTIITGRDWDALSAQQKADWHADSSNDGKTDLVLVLESKQFNVGQDDIPMGVNIMHRDNCVYIDTTDRKWARVSRNKWIIANKDGVFIRADKPE